MEFITTLRRRVSFRNGCYRRILCIEGSIYFFGYWLRVPRRPTESVRTKFGLMRSGKGEIILEEDSSVYVYKCIFFVLTCQWTAKNDWKHFMPSFLFAQCFQDWFVFIKTEHFQSFKKWPWTSIFDDRRPKFPFYFLLLAL